MAPVVVYVTGFRQHAGKTVTSLGLIARLRTIMQPERIGYFKPVGQELTPLPDGTMIDKDAVVINTFSGIPDLDLSVISPVRLAGRFTRDFLEAPDQPSETRKLQTQILSTLEAFADKDIIVAEGTGHPGVGSIVGLSNARVANLMKAQIVFLSGGGIGRALDQLEVDLSYFRYNQSRVRGVIFNKIIPSKIPMMRNYVTENLLNRSFGSVRGKLRILGFLPEIEDLGRPSMHLISRRWKGAEVLGDHESELWKVPVRDIKVLTVPDAALRREGFLFPGDLVIMSSSHQRHARALLKYDKNLRQKTGARGLGGLVITSGTYNDLDQRVAADVRRAGFPTIYVPDHTAVAEERLLDIFENTKLQIYDAHKIEEIERLFEEHFDLERFIDSLGIKT